MIALILSSDFTVKFLSKLAENIKLSPFIVSAFVLAIGTSLPELSSAIMAQLSKAGNLALSILIGSNVANLCLILSLVFIFSKKKYKVSQEEVFSSFFSLLPLLMILLFAWNGYVSRVEGLFLLSFFIIYHGYNYIHHYNKTKQHIHFGKNSIIPLLLVVFGIVGIVLSSRSAALIHFSISLARARR